ncbi:ATP-binding protein [Roseibium sp. RKSG952]|uniref:ATP-binding protein n=1 Tax=Roseibium sp. RKSG952 TaxID=2529384 RepID=UPI0012BCB326|nr:ATP-binding protein [Roseibium sp. RKSG952]MTH97911.1 HAMP domain-containing protein [Roseibium sp. RKSG952]
MKNVLVQVCPRRIAGQIMLLLLFALVSVAALFLIYMTFAQRDDGENESATIAVKNSIAIAELNHTPPDKRGAFIRALQATEPEVNLAIIEHYTPPSGPRHLPPFWPFREGSVGFGITLLDAEPGGGPVEGPGPPILYFSLADGTVVRAILAPAGVPGPPPGPGGGLLNRLYISLALFSLLLFVLLVWATRTLIRPLSQLSRAASSFGHQSMDPVPLAERGPLEVREAARAFNRMQTRINQFVDRRTRMLAAISHDLRTPLTRLRLRIHFMEDEDQKQRNLADLDLMENQLNSALHFLKQGQSDEPFAKIALGSFVQSLTDQFSDLGFEVSLEMETGLTVNARRNDLIRALSNLIDNARKYAGEVTVAVKRHNNQAEIRVIDHGPGIAEEDFERMLEPFERGDLARQVQPGTGFGLGLATSRGIAEAHGGSLCLMETPGGGLTVSLRLPLVQSEA